MSTLTLSSFDTLMVGLIAFAGAVQVVASKL